jgi:hypothetical protein
MNKDEMNALQGKMITATFLKLSDIPLSEDGGEDISNASNLTYGDSCHCLYRISDLIKEASFTDQEDENLLKDLKDEIGDVFVDLEN